MDSHLAPVLPNILISFHKFKWLNECDFNKLKFYLRYVDDIPVAFNNEQDSFFKFFKFFK